MNRRRDNFLDFDQFTVRFKRGDYRKYVFFSFFTLHLACKFVMLSRIKLVILLVHSVMHLSMVCRRGGGEEGRRGMGWGLIVFVGPGVGHLTDLVLPGEGIFESFFARRGDI